jgi:hypothetical protein
MTAPKTTTITQKKYEQLVAVPAELSKAKKRLGEVEIRNANAELNAHRYKVDRDKALTDLEKYKIEPTPALVLSGMSASLAQYIIGSLQPDQIYNGKTHIYPPMVQPAEAVKMLEDAFAVVERLLKAAKEDAKQDVTYIRDGFKDRY